MVDGCYQSEAYTLSGFKAQGDNIRKEASRLAARPDIKARIQELSRAINEERINSAVAVAITPHFIIHELLREHKKAVKRDRPEIAIRSLTEIARISGLYKQNEGHGGAVNVSIDLGPPTIEGEAEEVDLVTIPATIEGE